MSVVDGSFDNPLKLEERAAMPLAGGLFNHGYQCGMVWGAPLSAGAQAYRLFGPGPQAEAQAILAAQRLVEAFRVQNKSIDCLEITGADLRDSDQASRYFMRGGAIRCFRMAARYAPVVFREINATFSGDRVQVPSPPVSCASMLAKKVGVSDMHSVMVAGLAGGIGLSGAACGALGAAIWFIAMNLGREGIEKIQMTPPRCQDAIDRLVVSAGPELGCSRIVGRRFESIDDHAAYLHGGGCSEIIEELAALA
jgi:hypothetical protein